LRNVARSIDRSSDRPIDLPPKCTPEAEKPGRESTSPRRSLAKTISPSRLIALDLRGRDRSGPISRFTFARSPDDAPPHDDPPPRLLHRAPKTTCRLPPATRFPLPLTLSPSLSLSLPRLLFLYHQFLDAREVFSSARVGGFAGHALSRNSRSPP